MKGVVFVSFADFIEETWGLDFWDEALNQVKPASQGIYTTVSTYPDQELLDLVGFICDAKSISIEDALRAFGKWLFVRLHGMAPPQTQEFSDPFVFLRGVQDAIHVEVKKLNEDAILPEFKFLKETENQLTLEYISPRRLSSFCEGLIIGMGEFISQPLTVDREESGEGDNWRCILTVNK